MEWESDFVSEYGAAHANCHLAGLLRRDSSRRPTADPRLRASRAFLPLPSGSRPSPRINAGARTTATPKPAW